MAKKSTTKKSSKKAAPKSKKKTAVRKTSSSKSKVKKTVKKAAPKVKKTVKKTTPKVKKTVKRTAAKKTGAKKKAAVIKTTKKKTTEKKTSMAKSTSVKDDIALKQQEAQKAAEAKAKALQKIKGYGKRDLEHFKQIIMDKRNEIIEQLQNLKEQMLDPTTGEYINENSPYSLHMAEQGTDAMEREKTFLYAQRENKFLSYLEDALKRIEAGTYGICIECIDEPHHLCETCPLIPKARLEAVPHSQLCLPMKQKQEKR